MNNPSPSLALLNEPGHRHFAGERVRHACGRADKFDCDVAAQLAARRGQVYAAGIRPE